MSILIYKPCEETKLQFYFTHGHIIIRQRSCFILCDERCVFSPDLPLFSNIKNLFIKLVSKLDTQKYIIRCICLFVSTCFFQILEAHLVSTYKSLFLIKYLPYLNLNRCERLLLTQVSNYLINIFLTVDILHTEECNLNI